jgi:hypothetical protein
MQSERLDVREEKNQDSVLKKCLEWPKKWANVMRYFVVALLSILLLGVCEQRSGETSEQGGFSISFAESASTEPLDGRLIVVIATKSRPEPRFQQAGWTLSSAQIFGVDVNGLEAGDAARIGNSTLGFPAASLSEIPAGDYYVQAVLHKYETLNLASGHTVKLPMDQGEGQFWNRSPGNFYSAPQKIHLEQGVSALVEIVLDQKIPPIESPSDTKYVKHIKMKSDRLSEFWGRDTILGAHVLLPEGFDEHPEAKYPLIVYHGHFPHDFGGFRTTPPDPDIEDKLEQHEAYEFYKKWTDPDFPRVIIIKVQHPTPYFDDSYAVNSANNGPYGDAINYELIPYIEEKFRGIGEGWARFTYGGSTGGWEAAATQIFYPDEYNGAFAGCPDSIDFRAYELVNIYEDKNAYYEEGPFGRVANPAVRDSIGKIYSTVALENHYELVLGTKNRSGCGWDAWEAVYSPQGEDGYPKRLYDKKTGVIDHEVAEYWRANYDLRHIMERDWKTLGPKLEGKLYIYIGDMDTYYLNNAVYLVEEFLESTTDPYYNGEIHYGDREVHCWKGGHDSGEAAKNRKYQIYYMDEIMKRIEESAPEGADVTSWRY